MNRSLSQRPQNYMYKQETKLKETIHTKVEETRDEAESPGRRRSDSETSGSICTILHCLVM